MQKVQNSFELNHETDSMLLGSFSVRYNQCHGAADFTVVVAVDGTLVNTLTLQNY